MGPVVTTGAVKHATSLAREQDGVLTRAQALGAGLSDNAIRWNVGRGRWQLLHTGVYATFRGPVSLRCRLWAAVLAAGREAVLSHESAAELAGLVDRPAQAIHVTIPVGRKVTALNGVVIHRSKRVEDARHPALEPPQTRLEDTVIDLTQTAVSMRDAFGWLAKAVNSQRTTTDKLLAAMAKRPKLRWRLPLREALGDVKSGCRSVLELAYLRDVERPHGLPAAERQSPIDAQKGRRYLDVRYRAYGVRVELDGRAAHPEHLKHVDRERDNLAAEQREAPLRYDTPSVWDRPCQVAAQVVRALRHGGWSGTPRPCKRATCDLG